MTLEKNEVPSDEQKAHDGIVTEDIIKIATGQIDPEHQKATVLGIKALEPLVFKDILKISSDMKKYGRALGIGGSSLDQLGDIVATAYVRGFLVHRLAINKLDAAKLDDFYKMDWDAYCDKLIEAAMLKRTKLLDMKAIESIEPSKKDNSLEHLIDGKDIDN